MAERPEDLNLPNTVVTRIIKDAIPEGVNVSKEARLAVSKAASVFVLYATSCSNNFAMRGKRKTISAQDIISAMEDMEFDHFIQPLQQCLDDWTIGNDYVKRRFEEFPCTICVHVDFHIGIDNQTAFNVELDVWSRHGFVHFYYFAAQDGGENTTVKLMYPKMESYRREQHDKKEASDKKKKAKEDVSVVIDLDTNGENNDDNEAADMEAEGDEEYVPEAEEEDVEEEEEGEAGDDLESVKGNEEEVVEISDESGDT